MQTGLNDLPVEDRQRLTDAFATARKLWGPRAQFARSLGINESSVQVLEGKKAGPLSEEMIARLTAAVGWPTGHWRTVAAGELGVVIGTDQQMDIELVVQQLAQRVADLERTVAEQRQALAGEEDQSRG